MATAAVGPQPSSPSSASQPGNPALDTVLKHFPAVDYAFAYGSGAHHQPGLYDTAKASTSGPKDGKGAKASGPVLDLIFAVPDAVKWHEQVSRFGWCVAVRSALGAVPQVACSGGRSQHEANAFAQAKQAAVPGPQNLKRNPSHYSWLGRLGPEAVRRQRTVRLPVRSPVRLEGARQAAPLLWSFSRWNLSHGLASITLYHKLRSTACWRPVLLGLALSALMPLQVCTCNPPPGSHSAPLLTDLRRRGRHRSGRPLQHARAAGRAGDQKDRFTARSKGVTSAAAWHKGVDGRDACAEEQLVLKGGSYLQAPP
jgi:hypothetical protein